MRDEHGGGGGGFVAHVDGVSMDAAKAEGGGYRVPRRIGLKVGGRRGGK